MIVGAILGSERQWAAVPLRDRNSYGTISTKSSKKVVRDVAGDRTQDVELFVNNLFWFQLFLFMLISIEVNSSVLMEDIRRHSGDYSSQIRASITSRALHLPAYLHCL